MIEIIPNVQELEAYMELAEQHSLGFEYNDFFDPQLLDDAAGLEERIHTYQSLGRPKGLDTLHGAFYDLVPFSWDDGIRRHSLYRMQQSVEIACRLGCRAVVFHAGLDPKYMKGKKYYNNWLECMTEAMSRLLAQNDSLEIYCENVLETTPASLLELAERLEDQKHFGICVDVAHMMLAMGNPEEWFRALSPYIRHFHLNDNHLQTDDHLSLGRGSIDWNLIFDGMKRHKLWSVSRLLEVNGMDRIRESLDFLERME